MNNQGLNTFSSPTNFNQNQGGLFNTNNQSNSLFGGLGKPPLPSLAVIGSQKDQNFGIPPQKDSQFNLTLNKQQSFNIGFPTPQTPANLGTSPFGNAQPTQNSIFPTQMSTLPTNQTNTLFSSSQPTNQGLFGNTGSVFGGLTNNTSIPSNNNSQNPFQINQTNTQGGLFGNTQNNNQLFGISNMNQQPNIGFQNLTPNSYGNQNNAPQNQQNQNGFLNLGTQNKSQNQMNANNENNNDLNELSSIMQTYKALFSSESPHQIYRSVIFTPKEAVS